MTEQTIPVEKIREILDGEWSAEDKIQAIYEDLLPDPPLPDPLFLAKATHPEYGEGIVTSHYPDVDGDVRFMFSDEAIGDGTNYQWVFPSDLTFHTPDMSKNGAKIDTSTEHVDPIDTTQDHPEFLEAEEDYENAPEGTIVAADDYWSFARFNSGWITSTRTDFDYAEMAGIRRRVLRWGWQA